jgi:hypothetical protein
MVWVLEDGQWVTLVLGSSVLTVEGAGDRNGEEPAVLNVHW